MLKNHADFSFLLSAALVSTRLTVGHQQLLARLLVAQVD